ncbi:MAG: hypothetical protein ACRCVT_12350 [Leadbetterella sp.]
MSSTGTKKEMKEHCENHEECMKMIQAVLDGSATEVEIKHFRENKEKCQPCIEGYELEKSIKESLQSKLEKKCCPQSTLDQLKIKIGITAVLLLSGFLSVHFFICK